MVSRHIFACGGAGGFIGGGFLGSSNPKMREKMVAVCGTSTPHVLYIPTASGDPKEYFPIFEEMALARGYTAEILTLFNTDRWTSSPAEMIDRADIIWVGGGSTFNMLAIWRAWNLVPLLRSAYDNGTVIGGVSAGAICWFEQGNTDSVGPGLGVMECLGWIPGSCTPHYDEEELRKPILALQLREGTIKPGVAIDGLCCVHYVDEKLVEVISETPAVGAYRVNAERVERITYFFPMS